MRFDDRLATVLGREPDREAGRVAQWRQLLDIIGQSGVAAAPLPSQATVRFAALRASVPVDTRRAAVAAIADRPLAPDAVALIADDVPPVMGALLSRVRLDEAGWLSLLPRLTPTGRGFLRHRRDLDGAVAVALGAFGASDFALRDESGAGCGGEAALIAAIADRLDEAPELPLPDATRASAAAAPFEPDAGEGQIRAIISRIARFRSHRDDASPLPTPASRFVFETDADGVVRRVDGGDRATLVGETIAVPAHGEFGVDAQAPSAFRRRTPFRDARLTVAGAGPIAGEWRIAGVPVFGERDGRFLGYRCTARRPLRHESARSQPGVDPDTLRQLVHELRTPINAIGGFAEMIRRQMRGPVGESYRARAGEIVDDAARLMSAVDDLDISARLDGDRLALQRGTVALAPLIDAILADHREDGAHGKVSPVRSGDAARYVASDAATLRRIMDRLIGAAMALAAPGERIEVEIATALSGDVEVSVTRPACLDGVDAAGLLDPSYEAEGSLPDAPLLGLGFTLHLVRRLAAAAGGALSIEPRRFALTLARARDDAELAFV